MQFYYPFCKYVLSLFCHPSPNNGIQCTVDFFAHGGDNRQQYHLLSRIATIEISQKLSVSLLSDNIAHTELGKIKSSLLDSSFSSGLFTSKQVDLSAGFFRCVPDGLFTSKQVDLSAGFFRCVTDGLFTSKQVDLSAGFFRCTTDGSYV